MLKILYEFKTEKNVYQNTTAVSYAWSLVEDFVSCIYICRKQIGENAVTIC